MGFLGPAVFLTQLGRVSSPLGAVACMMASQGLDSFSQSGLYSNHQVSAYKFPCKASVFYVSSNEGVGCLSGGSQVCLSLHANMRLTMALYFG